MDRLRHGRDEAWNDLDFTELDKDWHRSAVLAASARPDALANDAAIASATASNATSNLSETATFQPGELSGLLAKGDRALARGIAKMVATGASPRSGPVDLLTPADPEAANMVAVIEWPSGATTEFGAQLNIGRDRQFCPFAKEMKSTHVSRQHAVLEVRAEGIRVRDLDSRNGTFVYGEKVPGGRAGTRRQGRADPVRPPLRRPVDAQTIRTLWYF